jgi:hypothetical protein
LAFKAAEKSPLGSLLILRLLDRRTGFQGGMLLSSFFFLSREDPWASDLKSLSPTDHDKIGIFLINTKSTLRSYSRGCFGNGFEQI